MSNILLVPLHLDALVLYRDELVVGASADFSRLPYCTGKQDLNSDVANISEDIVSKPFENHLLLKAGIHLHWSLPDALTRARYVPGNTETQDFPRVPNRWLVTRCDASGTVEKEQLIESDYLKPPANASQIESRVAIPYGQGPPFRYMGRVVELSDTTREKGEYYPRLMTAIGYGEPTFAAFYPNCFSVFGFFEEFNGNIDGRQYYLIGWYSDPQQDVLKTHIRDSLNPSDLTDSAKLRHALKEHFKWTITPTDNQEFPSRLICYARLIVGRPLVKQPNGLGSIAVGNTVTEALSACMAERLREQDGYGAANDGEDLKPVFEDQLEAMNLASKLEYRQIDVAAKLFEARHEKGFTAIPGGTLWTVRAESTANAAAEAGDTSTGITLPDELGHLLNTVNERQAEYDREWDRIESLRVQLFSDWYKYMLCAYPPDGARDSYPDIDEVELYISKNVASLQQQIKDAGTLTLKEDSTRIRGEADAPLTLAGKLAQAINELQAFVNSHVEENLTYKLKQVSGPRYWLPTEPAILIEGSVATPSDRHGQDGRESDGLLETQLLTGVETFDPSEKNLRERLRKRIAEIGGDRGDNFGFTTWDGQPWNPFLLEWQVEVFPIEDNSNIVPSAGRFHEDFIVANYELAENQVDLSLKPGKGKIMQAANMYSGRSILTPHASAQLSRQLNSYVLKEIFPLYHKAKLFDASVAHLLSWESSDPEAQMAQVEEWYVGQKSALLKGQKLDEDPGLTAFRGKRALKDTNSLSQSLGGFNDALLMHKQTPQLRVADPLGFDDYQPFANIVREVISNSIYSAPEPANDFNPIRSGMMKIHLLRLVDTFGQTKDLPLTKLLTSEPLSGANDDDLVSLPPRLVQPARVNFRWLAADRNEQEMNDHPATTPICGWVLANHLDDSLMIYDNSGKALGSLVKKSGRSGLVVEWLPAPGGRGISDVNKIANPHLQKMVGTIKKWGADFLDDFIAAIDSAVENIEPENFAQHQDLALLMGGRPLALVRASVNLELKGLPALHQGWNEFRQDMRRHTRDDNGFSSVKFPIRIGEYRQFNDGTVGYWKEKNGDYEDDVFYAPQSDEELKIKCGHLKTHCSAPDDMVFFQTLQNAPQILSLLIDPRGVVHATTGILPCKSISIPPDQYAAALQEIEITFLSTPILTDAGKIHLPLPEEAGYQWSWMQQDVRGKWWEVTSRGLVLKNAFAVFETDAENIWNELIAQKWIELDPADSTRASVTAKDKRKNKSLSERLKDKIAKIEDILDRAHIGPVDIVAKFSGQQEIREGWLKLSAAKTPKPQS